MILTEEQKGILCRTLGLGYLRWRPDKDGTQPLPQIKSYRNYYTLLGMKPEIEELIQAGLMEVVPKSDCLLIIESPAEKRDPISLKATDSGYKAALLSIYEDYARKNNMC